MRNIQVFLAALVLAVGGLAAAPPAPTEAGGEPNIPGWEYRSSLPGWVDDKCTDPTFYKPFTLLLYQHVGYQGQAVRICHSIYDLCKIPMWNGYGTTCSGENGNGWWHNNTSSFSLTYIRNQDEFCVKLYDARFWGTQNNQSNWKTINITRGSRFYPPAESDLTKVWSHGDFHWNDRISSLRYVSCNP